MGFPAITASNPCTNSLSFGPEQNQECVPRERLDVAPFSIKEVGYMSHGAGLLYPRLQCFPEHLDACICNHCRIFTPYDSRHHFSAFAASRSPWQVAMIPWPSPQLDTSSIGGRKLFQKAFRYSDT